MLSTTDARRREESRWIRNVSHRLCRYCWWCHIAGCRPVTHLSNDFWYVLGDFSFVTWVMRKKIENMAAKSHTNLDLFVNFAFIDIVLLEFKHFFAIYLMPFCFVTLWLGWPFFVCAVWLFTKSYIHIHHCRAASAATMKKKSFISFFFCCSIHLQFILSLRPRSHTISPHSQSHPAKQYLLSSSPCFSHILAFSLDEMDK